MKRAAFVLAVLAAIVFLLSGPGTRAGWFAYGTGLKLFAISFPLAAVALVLSIVVWIRDRHLSALNAVALLAAAVFTLVPAVKIAQAFRTAPIHDITTDPLDPPRFVAEIPLRGAGSNPVTYGGAAVAAWQHKAYPDIMPLYLPNVAPADAFARAMAAANQVGLKIMASVPAEGRIEGTATTQWFGFTDDIVIRVRPSGSGSRVDIRSESRVGRGDAGMNARRVRALLHLIQSPDTVTPAASAGGAPHD